MYDDHLLSSAQKMSSCFKFHSHLRVGTRIEHGALLLRMSEKLLQGGICGALSHPRIVRRNSRAVQKFLRELRVRGGAVVGVVSRHPVAEADLRVPLQRVHPLSDLCLGSQVWDMQNSI